MKKLKTNEVIICLKCGKELQQITEKHLKKCSNITVCDYKLLFPFAKIRTDWHSNRIKEINSATKSGDASPMKNPTHYNKMLENQLKAVQSDEYRKRVSDRQKSNNNNKHIFGPRDYNYYEVTYKMRLESRKRVIEKRKQLGLDGFIPMFNPSACQIFDEIAKKTNTHIQHALNGGEYFVEDLYYWIDGYDSVNNIVYEYDESRHFNKDGYLRKKDIIRQDEITFKLNCRFIRINEHTNIDDIISIIKN